MKFTVLIGSYARGDYDSLSDCDVLLINFEESNLETSRLPVQDKSLINYVYYDQETFLRLYDIGSLFLYHAFSEGILIEGSSSDWEKLKKSFIVQKKFYLELYEISKMTDLLSHTNIFGGRYLTPLVNVFTELKNACIFYLAHQGIYEFNKVRCFDCAIGLVEGDVQFKELKAFYDFSVRELNIDLPFDPNDDAVASYLLTKANNIVRDMRNACM